LHQKQHKKAENAGQAAPFHKFPPRAQTKIFFRRPATFDPAHLYTGQNGKTGNEKVERNIPMNTMKKILAVLLSAALTASLVACAGKSSVSRGAGSQKASGLNARSESTAKTDAAHRGWGYNQG